MTSRRRAPDRHASADGHGSADGHARRSERGQVLVIFVASMVMFVGLLAVVADVSWFWVNSLRVQRAADAAALAGVVWLPGDPGTGRTRARAEAQKNGYTHATGSVVVTADPDSQNTRRMNVTVSAPVPTFFMRYFGITQLTAVRDSKAEYVLPVPMGSPQNYYGVYELCRVSGSSLACSAQPGPVSGTLASQNFFGAIEGQGSNRSTGDAYAPNYNGNPTINAQYDPNGYYYKVEVPSAGATVWVFDPTFCATTSGPGGGHLGTGDHWLGAATPVSTYYRLWNTSGTDYTTADDVRADVVGDDNLFAAESQVDKSTAYSQAAAIGGQNNDFSDGGEPTLASTQDCAAGALPASTATMGRHWHNRWWPLASNVAAGVYRIQVMTTDPANGTANRNQNFENMFSLAVTGGGSGQRVYGHGRMITYANIVGGSQTFYLAQIDAIHAGKQMVIDLFDPGDVGQKAWLELLSPDGDTYQLQTFDYTADNGRSGTNTTCIQTFGGGGPSPPAGCSQNATSGGQFYGNSWLTITFRLPINYGTFSQGGGPPLTPTGETEAGWWKVRYTVNNANDTTTWGVTLRGNPVHLIVP